MGKEMISTCLLDFENECKYNLFTMKLHSVRYLVITLGAHKINFYFSLNSVYSIFFFSILCFMMYDKFSIEN